MIFVVDASVDHPITLRLRQDGHVAHSIKEIAPRMSDDDVLALANAHDARLITADKDFGDMVVRAGHVSAGVILVRLAGLRSATRAEVVASEIAEMADILRGSFTVITPAGIRVRPLSRKRRLAIRNPLSRYRGLAMKAPASARPAIPPRRHAGNDKGRDGGDQASRRAKRRAPPGRRGT